MLDAPAKQAIWETVFGREAECDGPRLPIVESIAKPSASASREHRIEQDAAERRVGKLRNHNAGCERTHPDSIRNGQAVVTDSGTSA